MVRLFPETPFGPAMAPSGACNLVLSWLESGDAKMVRDGGAIPTTLILRLVRRSTVHRVAIGAEIVLAMERPDFADDLVPIAILDIDRTFWQTVLAGGGLAGVASGPVEGSSVVIGLRPLALAADAATVARDAIDRHLVRDPLSGLSCRIAVRPLGDGEGSAGEALRAIYLLPGLGGTDVDRLRDRDFLARGERLAGRGNTRWLLVSVDTSTASGTHYLSDRSRHDGWLNLLTEQLAALVEARYGAAADPRARVLAGHSAGGLNALQVAMRAPGFFGTVLASAPDALDLGAWLLGANGMIRPEWCAWMRLEQRLGGQGQMVSYARSWSPSESSDLQWPCDLDTGRPVLPVLAAWLAASPSTLLDRAACRDALRGLRGRLVLGVARNDEFDLAAPAVRFGARLDGLGIGHRLLLDDAGHFDGSARLLRLMEASGAFASRLPDESP